MYYLEQPKDFSKELELLVNNSHLNLLPILELVVQFEPDYLEAFCNQAIVTVVELLRDGQKGGVMAGAVYELIVQLHTLREALRQVQQAPSWP
jgi:hypothetical protein